MANPQAENGHTDMANEVLEAFARTRIPGEARQVIDAILRKTWGWHKREDQISLSQLVLATGLPKKNIIRARNKLRDLNYIVILEKENESTLTYRFNKDFDSWKSFSKPRTCSNPRTKVLKSENKSFSKMPPTKETTKETTKESSVRAKPAPDPRVREFMNWWGERWLTISNGMPYLFSGGKEASLIKRALKVHSVDKLQEYASRFLSDSDDFTERAGRTIGIFYSRLNGYSSGPPPRDPTAFLPYISPEEEDEPGYNPEFRAPRKEGGKT